MNTRLIIDFEYFSGRAGFETGGRSSRVADSRCRMSSRMTMGGVIEVGEDLGAWTAAS
jgi:hypothetical protein